MDEMVYAVVPSLCKSESAVKNKIKLKTMKTMPSKSHFSWELLEREVMSTCTVTITCTEKWSVSKTENISYNSTPKGQIIKGWWSQDLKKSLSKDCCFYRKSSSTILFIWNIQIKSTPTRDAIWKGRWYHK